MFNIVIGKCKIIAVDVIIYVINEYEMNHDGEETL